MRGGVKSPLFFILLRMARNIEDWIAEVIRERNNIGTFIKERVEKNSGILILKPLKLRLFNKGTDGNGNLIGDGKYSSNTIRQKRKKGVRTYPVTLRLTGSWYRSMYVDVRATPFNTEINVLTDSGAKDEPGKTSYLIDKYGREVLTLNPLEQEVIAEDLSKELVKKINDIKLPKIDFI